MAFGDRKQQIERAAERRARIRELLATDTEFKAKDLALEYGVTVGVIYADIKRAQSQV